MRTSWTKLSGLILVAAAVAYGCGSDSNNSTPPAAEAGTKCGNKTLDKGEDCDGTLLGGKTCATAMLSTGTSGTLKCKSDCTFDATSCNKGSGGGGGTIGAGGAPIGNGGSPAGGKKGLDGGTADSGAGGKGTGGSGGTTSTDAGSKADASDAH